MKPAPDNRLAAPPHDPPWLALPREIVDVLRPMVPGIVEAIITMVPQTVPAYARPIEGRFGRGLRSGVAVALDRFLQLPGTRLPALSEESRQLVAGLGSGEFRQGRSMDALLSAYRMGARVTFREMSRISLERNLGLNAVVNLGESILAYIDELSAVSAEAYAFERSERAGAVERRRTELLELLLHGQADEAALRQAASMADWVLPARLAVVTLPLDRADGLRLKLGPGALVVERETDVVALVPAPRSKPAQTALEKALRGRAASVGPAGGWQQVPDSLRLAVLAAAVLPPREKLDDPPIWAHDHLGEIVLGTEPTAIAELAQRRLAPLQRLRPAQREKLAATLLSWLRHWGQRAPMAAELGIHAQTVGYRVAQLRELFAGELDDPRARFELELVLHAGRWQGPGTMAEDGSHPGP
ncbi:PucR family transcriptional regulator [Arthrobacter mobilis]|uniref:PucR family transcriptional regulator n=1 Tax=Arthrobacter mobilis TaxID=2724944 RepID=A0A7X6K6W8_9MICC|nr:helix-turn-helix domain-containing protein [Arthrobacter mobilis]NKX55808.1 PucR family transcriptional regulator [Arthrobacter mobilis]